jgi:hypothetical protein
MVQSHDILVHHGSLSTYTFLMHNDTSWTLKRLTYMLQCKSRGHIVTVPAASSRKSFASHLVILLIEMFCTRSQSPPALCPLQM